MEASEFANIDRLEETFWRYVGARELISGWVGDLSDGSALATLDAGCGTGRVMRDLTDHRTFGCDISFDAIRLAKKDSTTLVRAGVCDVPFQDETFDVVISLDVLYHLGVASDVEALREFRRVLRPGGTLLLQLPAFESLRSAHDRITHTRHRYRRRDLGEKLRDAGFDVRSLSYWNCLLFPLAAALRLTQRLGDKKTASDLRPLPAPINRLFTAILRLENRWLRRGWRLPWGLSVFAIAQRPTTS